MVTAVSNDNYYEFRGLSSDEKPIGNDTINKNVEYKISNGSIFFEMDTGRAFMYSLTPVDDSFEGTWLEV